MLVVESRRPDRKQATELHFDRKVRLYRATAGGRGGAAGAAGFSATFKRAGGLGGKGSWAWGG